MNKVKSNKAECFRCGEILESVHRHDYRTHSCSPEIFFMLDGGLEYVRRGWGGDGRSSNPNDHYIERSEYEE